MQTPYVGGIVWFHGEHPATPKDGQPYAAMILHVYENNVVALEVFGGTVFAIPSGADLEHVEYGTGPGQWSWPEIPA